MFIIKEFLRYLLKKKMRSKSLKDSRNIFHQLILYFFYRRKKKFLLRNKELKNSFYGKRCFILFTGTSIAEFDFNTLKGENVIAVGLSPFHKSFDKCNVIAYLNPGTWEPRSLLFFFISLSSAFKKTKKGCKIFLDTTAFPYLKELIAYRVQDTYYISSNSNYLSTSDVNIDISKLNNIQEGSISAALGVASYLGFKEINLLGADYLSDPPVWGHFYDGFSEIGRPADFEDYRERAIMIIDYIENMNSNSIPKFKVNRNKEKKTLMIDHINNKKTCKIINVVKDDKQVSIIKSITFQELENGKIL